MDTKKQPIIKQPVIPTLGDGGTQIDAYVTTGGSPPLSGSYYSTTNPDEANWLCDKWDQSLAGKLAAASYSENDPDVLRRLCGKLGLWTFRETDELLTGVKAYQGGPHARHNAILHRQAVEDRAAEAAYYSKLNQCLARVLKCQGYHSTRAWSLDQEYNKRKGQKPMTLPDLLAKQAEGSDGAAVLPGEPAGTRSAHRPIPWDCSPWAGSERHPGTFISPHPRYNPDLDTPLVAQDAVRWLYHHEYWGLLERLGVTADDATALDARWGGPLLNNADGALRKSERLLDKATGSLVEMYHMRTGHTKTLTEMLAA